MNGRPECTGVGIGRSGQRSSGTIPERRRRACQRLKWKFFLGIFVTNLNLSFVYVRGEVGHDYFLSEDVAWQRGPCYRGRSRAPCGGLSSSLAGDSSLGSTSSTTRTAGIPPLLGNDLRKRSDIASAEWQLHTSSRDLSRTIADAIRMFFRVI